MRPAILVLTLTFPFAFAREPGRSPEPSARRQRPPSAIPCPRDRLTSYTGKVIWYSRTDTRLQLRVRTDWDTDEQFTIRWKKGEDPADRFLLRSGSFQPRDWSLIESAKGRLRPRMRVTVWECTAGRSPALTLDWEPPPAIEKRR